MDKMEIDNKKEELIITLNKIEEEAKLLSKRCNVAKQRLVNVNTEEELKQFCFDDKNDLEKGFGYIEIIT